MDPKTLLQNLRAIAVRPSLPFPQTLASVFVSATSVLENLSETVRPRASDGRAGGLLELSRTLPTIVVPDLHARPGLLIDLLNTRTKEGGTTVAELLATREIQVLFLGDGPHTEGPEAAPRWRLAWKEFQGDWSSSKAMTEEMTLAFNAMEIVARLIVEFPGTFLFLKGNHDNILNEEGNGNHAFGKYAYEGQMALDWTRHFLGPDFVEVYTAFERAFPLVARGGGFLATHAEPAFPIHPEDALEARLRPHIVEALTWTANDEAKPDAVSATLAEFLPLNSKPGVAFGGHRAVRKGFELRSGGLFVQIHDMDRSQAALVYPDRAFDPVSDIISLA